MNKKALVFLLQKDIKELGMLTTGFDKMDRIPEILIELANRKATDIITVLQEFAEQPVSGSEVTEDHSTGNNDSTPEIKTIYEGSLDQDNKSESPGYQEGEKKTDSPEKNTGQTVFNRVISDINKTVEPENQPLPYENANEEPTTKQEETKSDVEVTSVTIEETAEIFNEPLNEPETFIENIIEKSHSTEMKETIITTRFVSLDSNSTLNDKLAGDDDSLSKALINLKIDDIRQAINIGDRFRFQRELFGGNGEILNKTISYLNQLAKFDEAEAFLKSKFNWEEDNQHAEDFLQIIRRRYL